MNLKVEIQKLIAEAGGPTKFSRATGVPVCRAYKWSSEAATDHPRKWALPALRSALQVEGLLEAADKAEAILASAESADPADASLAITRARAHLRDALTAAGHPPETV